MRRVGGWVVAAAATGLVLCAPASAALPPPGLEVGGGGVRAGKGSSSVIASARVGDDGRSARLTGTIGTACPGRNYVLRRFLVDVALADDGTFAAQGLRTDNAYGGGYPISSGRVAVSGTFDGSTAAGTVELTRASVKRAEGRSRCPDTTGTFALRDPGRPSGLATAAPAPGTIVYGLTDRRTAGVRGGVLARVSKSGRRLDRFNISAGLICGGDAIFEQLVPVKRLTPDGRYDVRERFRTVFDGLVERWRTRTRGSFLPGGALAGRFDATIRARYTTGRRKGRVGICRPAARIRFWAVP